jgi:hypothetical protein
VKSLLLFVSKPVTLADTCIERKMCVSVFSTIIQRVLSALSSVPKRLGPEADHSPSSAKVKNN